MKFELQQTPTKWLPYKEASAYCGLSVRTLQNYEKAKLIIVANIIQPGSTRGRKLVSLDSLDCLIEGSIGVKTKAPICRNSEITDDDILLS